MRIFSPLLLAAFFCLTVAVFTGCTSAPEVRLDKQPGVSLARFETFGFAASPSDAALLDLRMRQAVRAELERRNFVYTERAPALLVSFTVAAAPRDALTVEMIDVEQNVRVWRGTATGRLASQALKERGEALERAIGTLFIGFAVTRPDGHLASASCCRA